MISICQSCDRKFATDVGVCDFCGSVALRPLRKEAKVSLTGGMTPIIQSRQPELRGTWLKLESANETGSFKDRIMRLLVSEAKGNGYELAVVASSGNAAISASFHAARAGLGLVVVVPVTLSPIVHGLLSRFPILIIQFGIGPAQSHNLARRLARELGVPNLSSTFSSSGTEYACRSIGHEIAEQLSDVPLEVVASSVSVGPVLLGTRNGLLEAQRNPPAMVAGQALGCSPIVRAFESHEPEVTPWNEPVTTEAASIADTLESYAQEATFFLSQLRSSGGFMAAADDESLDAIRRNLRETDGVDVELACCAAIFALERSGRLGPSAVAILTGSGQRETLRDEHSLRVNRHPESETFTPANGDMNAFLGKVLLWRAK